MVVRLNLQKRHPAVRSRGDGERDVDHFIIGIGRTGISRDVLVVDIYRTLDVPIVGWNTVGCLVLSLVLATNVVAVVDDGLAAMHKVAGRLPFLLVCIILVITVFLEGDSIRVQRCQDGVRQACCGTLAVHVLGIDETTAKTWLHTNKVKLYDTCDVAPVLLVEAAVRTLTLLCGQLQIDA